MEQNGSKEKREQIPEEGGSMEKMEQKQMEGGSAGGKEFNVDEALERLEEINRRLADKDISLKDSMELYKEGTKLAAACRERLIGVEKELQIIEE